MNTSGSTKGLGDIFSGLTMKTSKEKKPTAFAFIEQKQANSSSTVSKDFINFEPEKSQQDKNLLPNDLFDNIYVQPRLPQFVQDPIQNKGANYLNTNPPSNSRVNNQNVSPNRLLYDTPDFDKIFKAPSPRNIIETHELPAAKKDVNNNQFDFIQDLIKNKNK